MARPKKTLIAQETTEARVLNAAEEVFGRVGFAAARLEDIARAAQIQRPSLLYYFASKEDLYAAVVRQVFGRLEAVLLQSIQSEGDFAARLDAVLAGFLEFLAQNPSLPALVLRELLDGKGPGQALLMAGVAPLLAIIERFVGREGQSVLRPEFPVREAILMLASSTLLRAATDKELQQHLWGNKDSTRELARVLLIGVQYGTQAASDQPQK